VLRAAGLPVRYTEGFNPHIRLSMGPALGVGHEGLSEVFDVDCTAPIRPTHLERANRLLADGLRLEDARPLLQGAPSLGKMVARARYRLRRGDGAEWPPRPPEAVRDAVTMWTPVGDGTLLLELNQRDADGPVAGLRQLFASIGIDPTGTPPLAVARDRLVLLPPGAQARPDAPTADVRGGAA